MPKLTPKLGLNTWLENEIVNFEEINANFERLDVMPMCVESGTKTASYSGTTSGTTPWYYRKYSDGTIDMFTCVSYTDLICSKGSSAPYYSEDSKVYLPFDIMQFLDVQMHLVTPDTYGWVVDATDKVAFDHVKIRVASNTYELNSSYDKRVYISIKGVLNNG